jgi:hypothetical protein
MVDFPAPFSPIIKVDEVLSNCISVIVLPVESRFFQRTYLKVIKVLSHSLLSITISSLKSI